MRLHTKPLANLVQAITEATVDALAVTYQIQFRHSYHVPERTDLERELVRALHDRGEERSAPKRRLVVVGNGMVGHRLIQAVAERGLLSILDATVVAEESRLAYDRVNLSKWFDTAGELDLVRPGEYEALGVEVV